MARVLADITVSVDGFVTGPDAGPDRGLGRGGEPLHAWVDEPDDVDAAVLREVVEATGAVVMGRRLFDVVDGPHGWTDEMGYGAKHAAAPPFVVVTHAPPQRVRLDLDFTFVAGLPQALGRAQELAGGGDVVVMGGGQVVASAVREGLVDELLLHVSPLVLGGGTPLFGPGAGRLLSATSVRPSAHAVHVRYAVGGPLPAG